MPLSLDKYDVLELIPDNPKNPEANAVSLLQN